MRSRKRASGLYFTALVLFFLFFCWSLTDRSELPSETMEEAFVLFLAPKPGFDDNIPDAIISWRDQLVRVNGKVVLLLNEMNDIQLAASFGFKTAPVRVSEEGFPQLDSLLEIVATFNKSTLVGFCNSDLLPGPNFADAVSALAQLDVKDSSLRTVDSDLTAHDNPKSTEGWLVVVSRVDFVELLQFGPKLI